MSDTLMAIIGIFLATILMFVFPIMEIAGKSDEMSQTVVQVAVSDFVNKVTSQGKITQFDYNELVQKLYATGNSYDIEIEAQILDDNPRRATATGSSDLIGEYKYYSVYTNTILDSIDSDDGEYILKKDDYIVVNVKNTNITLGTQLKNFMYKLIGKNTYSIGATSSALVLNGGTAEVEHAGNKTPNTKTYPEKNIIIRAKQIVTTTETISQNMDIVVVLDCEHYIMPWHNDKNNSQIFIQKIIKGVQGKGNLGFILTSNPTHIYTDLSNVGWIYDAEETTAESNYSKAMKTALDYVKNKNQLRVVVFLSWEPGESYLRSGISTLKNNQSSFDLFFTTACCGEQSESKTAQWFNAIKKEKTGGILKGNDIEQKFSSLVNKTVTKTETKDLPISNSMTQDLKIYLGMIDLTSPVEIKVNNSTYTIGKNLPSYVVYFDTTKSQYVIDLKLVGELLSMTTEDWQNASIELSYVMK